MSADQSNGYEAIAEDYIKARSNNGQSVIENWAASLPSGASIIDIGAGHGMPVTNISFT